MSATLDLANGDPRGRLVEELRRQLGGCESDWAEEGIFSSGIPALDRLLAGGGLRYGMLTEWLSELARSPATTLSLLCAREACRQGGVLVLIDRRQTFYPPAAAVWGVDLDRLLIVRPQNARDELWAAVQALRSPAVAAMWVFIDRLDGREFRRLQLAAEAGRTLGLLLRPSHVRGQPSWADVRLGISGERGAGSTKLLPAPRSPLPAFCRHVQVQVLRTRGGRAGDRTTLEIDDAAHTVREVNKQHDSHPLPVVSELANPVAHPLSVRA